MANLDSYDYRRARAKIDELRDLLDRVSVVEEVHLEALDEAIHTLKVGLPLSAPRTLPNDVEGK